MGTALASLLVAAVLTVSDRGLVFAPVLAPDASRLAWAAVEDDGRVSLQVAPLGEGAVPVRVATFAQQVPTGRRLAMKTMLAGPWSPDGTQLFYLTARDAAGEVEVHVVRADGTGDRPVGPRTGSVLAADWLDAQALLVAHQEAPGFPNVLRRVALADDAVTDVHALAEGARVLDLAVSPDGKWAAVLALEGPPEQRARVLRVIGLGEAADLQVLRGASPGDPVPNFICWSPDGTRLYFTDTHMQAIAYWSPRTKETTMVATDAIAAVPLDLADGTVLIANGSDGGVQAIFADGGERRSLGRGCVACSAAGGKLALVRTGLRGGAVLVADVDREALERGDIGLPAEEIEPPALPPAGGEGEGAAAELPAGMEGEAAASPAAPPSPQGGGGGGEPEQPR
ncbi:MAG: hypothetical protein KatS3mg102_0411 [Planctomycetota bacterium]|nr:MAG: hypothetical protein KatS3mg102_0411 [Planctomycetota bacterium]